LIERIDFGIVNAGPFPGIHVVGARWRNEASLLRLGWFDNSILRNEADMLRRGVFGATVLL